MRHDPRNLLRFEQLDRHTRLKLLGGVFSESLKLLRPIEKKQVAVLAEASRLADAVAEASEVVDCAARQGDVYPRGELLADAAGTLGRSARSQYPALDQRNVLVAVGGQVVGDRQPDHAAADDHYLTAPQQRVTQLSGPVRDSRDEHAVAGAPLRMTTSG